MAQSDFCGTCGSGFFLECSDSETGPYILVPQLAKDVDFERNVDVTEGDEICNETTGNQRVKVCEDEISVSYSATFDVCPENPICDIFVPGECKWIRMHHAPFDGTSYWQNSVRIGPYGNVTYGKGRAVRPQITFDGLGQETKPANF